MDLRVRELNRLLKAASDPKNPVRIDKWIKFAESGREVRISATLQQIDLLAKMMFLSQLDVVHDRFIPLLRRQGPVGTNFLTKQDLGKSNNLARDALKPFILDVYGGSL